MLSAFGLRSGYLARLFGFFLADFLCGSGGVASMRRNTSSGFGIGLVFCVMAGV